MTADTGDDDDVDDAGADDAGAAGPSAGDETGDADGPSGRGDAPDPDGDAGETGDSPDDRTTAANGGSSDEHGRGPNDGSGAGSNDGSGATASADDGDRISVESDRRHGGGPGVDSEDLEDLAEEVAALREELADFERDVDDRTLHRDDVESELKRYVRKRQRRGHATGWGPYLVLLYGTAMTVGAYYYLGNAWAVLAMIVVWLSTLGLYVFMVVSGLLLGVVRKAGGLRDLLGKLRS